MTEHGPSKFLIDTMTNHNNHCTVEHGYRTLTK